MALGPNSLGNRAERNISKTAGKPPWPVKTNLVRPYSRRIPIPPEERPTSIFTQWMKPPYRLQAPSVKKITKSAWLVATESSLIYDKYLRCGQW